MSSFSPPGPDFDEFVQRASVDLLRLGFLLTRDQGHAEDLVQAALVRTASHWSASRHNPSAYARRVVVNLAKDRWRDKSRRPCEVQDLIGVEPARDSGEERIVQRDEMSRLVAQLPMGQRKVLVLRYFEDLSVAEVALILGSSEGNVKSQSNRALATLRKLHAASISHATKEEQDACRS